MRHALLLLLALPCGCAHVDRAELLNGYTVWALSPAELYLAAPDNELIAGPKLKSVAISDPYVIAFCGWDRAEANGFENTVGYTVVDTRTGAIDRFLSEGSFSSAMRSRGVVVTLEPARQRFRR